MKRTEPLSTARPLLRVDAKTGKLRERRYKIVVVSGPQAGETVPLVKPLVIGSHEDSGLRLEDASVSRNHAELHPQADGVRVRDLKSTNGTYLGGAKVQEALVETEALLKLGRCTVRICMDEEDLNPSSDQGLESFGEAISLNPAMRQLFARLQRVSFSDSTVLLLGETGTGKDILARAIHQSSPRRDKPFVVVDCGALSPSLIESELFGHRKGAFTGADSNRTGAFLEASGGTLFLDEIGELPLETQPKLLRALESGSVKPLGEDLFHRTHVRVVAATHRDLQAEVEAGRFRRDLYFRLAVIPLQVPPLRERAEDVPMLAEHFARIISPQAVSFGEELLTRASAYHWPGNVRELRNVVERVISGVAAGDLLQLPNPADKASAQATATLLTGPFKEAKEQLLEEFTRAYLTRLKAECDGNLSLMSRKAGVGRNYIRDLLQRYVNPEE